MRLGACVPHTPEILALIEVTPDLTLAEIAAHLKSQHGLWFAVSTVWRLLNRHGLTVKKRARQ
ncbi:winged helix-turn-helix domain-containing protein [Azospirillum sp. A26]|uniref:winged helix-turn-helix domain-containing protein n=1 Tax=Azospirillum sp. A26 TaxID=3160607 RepID=UPI0036720408